MRIWTKYKLIYLALVSVCYFTPGLAKDAFNDWLPLPSKQSICKGRYILPKFKKNNTNQDITAQADNTRWTNRGLIYLKGNVSVLKGNNRLYTQDLTLKRDPKTNRIISGNTRSNTLFEQPSLRIFSNQAKFSDRPNIIELSNTQYRFYNQHARGNARKITITNNNEADLQQVNYTTCPPNQTFWLLSAKKILINKKKNEGKAYNATLRIKGVPILYAPYLSFPVTKQRKSGFLMPTFGVTRHQSYIGIPYYFNLAPNYDWLLKPIWYEKQGLLYKNTGRYLSEHNRGKLQLDYLYHDKQTQNNRYLIAWENQFHYSPFLRSNIHFNQLSDDQFLKDFGNDLATTNTLNLDKNIELLYTDPYNNAQLSAQHWDSLEPSVNNTLTNYSLMPGLSWSSSYPNLNSTTNAHAAFDLDRFQHTISNNLLPAFATRFHLVPGITYNWSKPYGYMQANAILDNRLYNVTNSSTSNISDNLTKIIPSFTLDNGLFFDRDITINHQLIHQTFEPKLTYQFTPYVDQTTIPLFDTGYQPLNANTIYNSNRFAGYDRISNMNQIIAAGTSRWFTAQGDEKSHLTIGQQLQFSANKVNLCTQDDIVHPDTASYNCIQSLAQAKDKNHLFGILNYNLTNQLSWQTDFIWANSNTNPYTLHLGLNYQTAFNQLINLSLYQSNDKASFPGTQLHFTTHWQLNNQWNLLGTSYYDIKKNDFINNFIGLEYESCCWAIRAGARRWLNPQSSVGERKDSQIYFEFALKGLGQFGPSYRNLVESNIPNYQDNFGHL